MSLLKFLLLFCLSVSTLFSEMRFGGPLLFKGEFTKNSFEGSAFIITAKNEGFLFVCKEKESRFLIPEKKGVLHDAVLSRDKSAIAFCIRYDEDDGGQSELLGTFTKDGVVLLIKYPYQEMTKKLGWIVELGAVSDEGTMVLAKCAKFLPPREGINFVNHTWSFLSVTDKRVRMVKELEISELEFKWPK